jgi:hypothetical protein
VEFLFAAHGHRATPCQRQYIAHFFEVTREGEIVWEYVNPFFGRPFFGGPPHSETNQVFRALRYSPEEIAQARAG